MRLVELVRPLLDRNGLALVLSARFFAFWQCFSGSFFVMASVLAVALLYP